MEITLIFTILELSFTHIIIKKKKKKKKEEGLIENDEGINLCVQNGSVKLELRD